MATGSMHGVPVLLCKPMTFMNVSGESVAPIMKDNGLQLSQVNSLSNSACQQPDNCAIAPKQTTHLQNNKRYTEPSHDETQPMLQAKSVHTYICVIHPRRFSQRGHHQHSHHVHVGLNTAVAILDIPFSMRQPYLPLDQISAMVSIGSHRKPRLRRYSSRAPITRRLPVALPSVFILNS